MKINPVMNSRDRVGSLVIGAGLVALAAFGSADSASLRIFQAIAGAVFLIGAIGGT